ncbi:MAG TPA: thiamine pyrophosphate-binding protein [Armatimonadota bacterium]|nr:thiamine pyrophosphate-binding protein [Armatimonadota bacterium]
MKVSDYVATALAAYHVPVVFHMPGGMITHLLDSLHCDGQIPLVTMHHEQAAAFAADAVGRMTGRPAIAMATSGPGAINLLNGIASCYFDSVPAVFITGQVNRAECKGSRPVRQLGFQETDIVAMAQPVTKGAWQILDPQAVPAAIQQAFVFAMSNRPGPVLLDLPMDVQRMDIGTTDVPPLTIPLEQFHFDTVLSQLQQALANAERPLILLGGGIRSACEADRCREFVEKLRVPVVYSLMGADVLPVGHPYRVGLIGTYGNRWANYCLAKSDCILVLGSRLDIRQTGAQVDQFTENSTIFQVDIDAGEVNQRVRGCQAIISSLTAFFDAMLAKKLIPCACSQWMAVIDMWRRTNPDTEELGTCKGIQPNELMHAIAKASSQAVAFVTDVGQHQMWAAQSLYPQAHQRILTSGGLGSMGYALPGAIGASLATGGAPVVMIAGDGGMQCNLQELQTVVRNRLPLKMLVLDNGSYGMVRQFQQQYFSGRCVGTRWGYSAPDFVRVASAYGLPAQTVTEPGAVQDSLQWLWEDPLSPALLHVGIDVATDIAPKMAFGKPLTEMDPTREGILVR